MARPRDLIAIDCDHAWGGCPNPLDCAARRECAHRVLPTRDPCSKGPGLCPGKSYCQLGPDRCPLAAHAMAQDRNMRTALDLLGLGWHRRRYHRWQAMATDLKKGLSNARLHRDNTAVRGT